MYVFAAWASLLPGCPRSARFSCESLRRLVLPFLLAALLRAPAPARSQAVTTTACAYLNSCSGHGICKVTDTIGTCECYGACCGAGLYPRAFRLHQSCCEPAILAVAGCTPLSESDVVLLLVISFQECTCSFAGCSLKAERVTAHADYNVIVNPSPWSLGACGARARLLFV